jgi:hypothetical protein
MPASEDGHGETMKLVEDEHTGALRLVHLSSGKSSKGKRVRSEEDTAACIRRGVIRFMVIVIDCSEIMNSRDMRPTRLSVASQAWSPHTFQALCIPPLVVMTPVGLSSCK